MDEIQDAQKVCDYFINLNGLCAASTSIYLRYFSAFINFLHERDRHLFSDEEVKELDLRIARWHCSLKKKALRENIEKRRKSEQETQVNIELIQKYLSSDIREELLQGILKYEEGSELLQSDYYKFRAALIGEVIYRNSQRSGVVIGLRASEVDSGKNNEEVLKILIHEHKSGKIKPAVIFMKGTAKDAFIKYKNCILPQIWNSHSKDYFFVSYKGRRISHKGVTTSLTSLHELNGKNIKITATASRKAAATFIAKSNPEKTQLVADFMQHQHSTAEKYYRQMGGGSHLIAAYEEIGKLSV